MKLTGRRKDRVIREKTVRKERKMELSKREQSDTTTTMRTKHGCDGMSADPKLTHVHVN